MSFFKFFDDQLYFSLTCNELNIKIHFFVENTFGDETKMSEQGIYMYVHFMSRFVISFSLP